MKKIFSRESKKDFYILYTIIFAGISLFIFGCFYLNGKSMVWSHDGVPQHVNSLAYYGEYLREFFHTLFVEHKLSIPMWDLHIGYGSDILTTLHYYVIGDPLAFLSVFVPSDKTEILYEILIFVRIYLAGITFSLYCFSHKNPKQAVLLGTLIYIFAGWTIYASMKHPYFANPMIYLPLILMGIDKIYKKEKPQLFICSTAVAAMSNFYFFYMLCIFMFLYAAFRYFGLFGKRSIRELAGWFLKFVGYFLVAVMIAAVIFLPVIMTMFGTDRFQAEHYVPLLYDRIYYEKYLGCLIGENMIQWGVAGYSAVAVAGAMVIFSKRKKYTELKLGFLMMNLFLLIPFAGHVLNGFSYVSNRWIWAYGMLIAYIFVKAYPELFTLTLKEKRRIFIMFLLYCFLALYAKAGRTDRNLIAVLLLAVSVLTVVSYGNIFAQGKYLSFIMAGILVVSILLNVSYQYSYEKDYLSEFSERGQTLSKLEAAADKVVLATGDDSIYRYDQFGSLAYANSSMQMGTNSTAYYFSLANGSISRFFNEMYLCTPWEQHYKNLDSRTILDRLAAVKYFVIHDENYGALPYGYRVLRETYKKNGKEYKAFENENALPLGYTYESYIPRAEYEDMTVTQKQQALLQGVVVEDSTLPKTEVSFNDRNMEYTMETEGGCALSDGKITVTQENAKVKLNFQQLGQSETYLVAENLNYDGLSPRELVSDREFEKMSKYQQKNLLYEDSKWRYWKEGQEASVEVASGTVAKTMKIFNDKYNAYSGKHNFLFNVGYRATGGKTVMLTFKNTGVYTYDSLKLVCQPMSEIEPDTAALGEEPLENIVMGVNEITGRISLSQKKALVLALPYSEGFRAYVDGEETKIQQANTMYMALEVPEGEHEIRLTYCTPYVKAGAILTLAGLVILLGLCIFERRKRTTGKMQNTL